VLRSNFLVEVPDAAPAALEHENPSVIHLAFELVRVDFVTIGWTKCKLLVKRSKQRINGGTQDVEKLVCYCCAS
jgi:hypothetical protein